MKRGGDAPRPPPIPIHPTPERTAMLHRITGRATKCGPSAISAIAGVPTHEAAAVIRRLFDRPSVNGVFIDELAAALTEFGWIADYAIFHPKYRERRFARREEAWERIFTGVPFDVCAMTLGTFLDPAPAGTWAMSASNHFVAYSDGFVADSGAWLGRKPRPWFRADPDCDRVARRRIREAVRFVCAAPGDARRNPAPGSGQALDRSPPAGAGPFHPPSPQSVPQRKEAPVIGKFLVRSRLFTLGIGAAMDSRFHRREEAETYVDRAMKHFPGSRYDIREDAAGPGPQPE